MFLIARTGHILYHINNARDNLKTLILETLIVTPPENKIKITVCEPSLLNANPKLVIVA